MLGELLPSPEAPRRGQTERTRLWGVALLTVRARPTPRCLDRAAVRLRAAGLRRAACPAEPMVLAALERTGLEPVTERTALPSFAAELTVQALAALGRAPASATVRLCAGRRGRGLDRAARELAVRVRHVEVETPDGGPLRESLRRQFGLADHSGGAAVFSLLFDPLPEVLPPPPGLWLSREEPPALWYARANISAPPPVEGGEPVTGSRAALLLTAGVLNAGAVTVHLLEAED